MRLNASSRVQAADHCGISQSKLNARIVLEQGKVELIHIVIFVRFVLRDFHAASPSNHYVEAAGTESERRNEFQTLADSEASAHFLDRKIATRFDEA